MACDVSPVAMFFERWLPLPYLGDGKNSVLLLVMLCKSNESQSMVVVESWTSKRFFLLARLWLPIPILCSVLSQYLQICISLQITTSVEPLQDTMFRSVGDDLKLSSHRIRRVKTVLEHIGLYVGLALYTAVGGKVAALVECYCSSLIFFEGFPDGWKSCWDGNQESLIWNSWLHNP